jgi:hypothetical protein
MSFSTDTTLLEMKMKSKRIAKYAGMASEELHTEYMNIDGNVSEWYVKDIMSEVIDKLDRIEAMANDNWFRKMKRKMK